MTNPFVFNVATLLSPASEGMPEQRTQNGAAPERIGVEMIALPEGADVTVAATLTPLGSGILVDADVTGELVGECSRCLAELRRPLDLHVSQVFAADDDFISGDEADATDQGSGDDIPEVKGDEVDLLQSVIDEAGLNLPFAPTCEDGCEAQTSDGVTTGVSGEGEDGEDKVDPRWAGLEKFL